MSAVGSKRTLPGDFDRVECFVQRLILAAYKINNKFFLKMAENFKKVSRVIPGMAASNLVRKIKKPIEIIKSNPDANKKLAEKDNNSRTGKKIRGDKNCPRNQKVVSLPR